MAADGRGANALYVLGCDPGKTGAIVGVGRDKLVILRTPHMKSPKGRGEEILYSHFWNEFAKAFLTVPKESRRPSTDVDKPHHAFIERVQAMPQQGGSSMFKFGYSAGFLRGLIVAAGIPLDLVEPQAWKKTVGIKNGSDKKASITRACQLWPSETEQFMPKRGHWDQEACIGVCDAALIAYHGLRVMTGEAHNPAPTETYEDI